MKGCFLFEKIIISSVYFSKYSDNADYPYMVKKQSGSN